MKINDLIEHLQAIQSKNGNLDVLIFDSDRMVSYENVTDKNIIDYYFPYKDDIRVIESGCFDNRKILVFVDKKILRLRKPYNKQEYKKLIKQMI